MQRDSIPTGGFGVSLRRVLSDKMDVDKEKRGEE